ncbi:Uncharacterised protein [Mycobacteroides abscessus subsp. abscessus]|nr:Uncharacterised protein [Mycobacteroides abscessus subsp. abscessus]
MPNSRTATTATVSSRIGGCCQARVISHADTPARARALPSAAEPRNTASARRGSRGRSRSTANLTVDTGSPSRPDDLITDGQHGVPVSDDDDGRAGRGTGPDRLEDPDFQLGIQM